MKNRELAPCPQPRKSNVIPLPMAKGEGLSMGTRFFQAGHWWEIDGHIHGRATSYYKCKPVCGVESRFYTESEIRQALNEQLAAMNMNHSAQEDGRGTGRFTADLHHDPCTPRPSTVARRRFSPSAPSQTTGKPDTLKILLVGTRDTVKRAISSFHSMGYANTADWSPFQVRPNSKEVLSILVQKI
ncbi:MAG: hypothetical protein EA367_06185 [Leptolyngbya sp. DLM2.Bin15]|nr:MAG: hypothetical protein EA367_06185 [Leptolyngbya sp. DLM2.Bin15]